MTINAADLIVVRDDLEVVVTAIDLARRTLKTIRGNLAWAFGYNVAAIPLAALRVLQSAGSWGGHGTLIGLCGVEQLAASA